jgi:hypothetical protein
VTVRTFSFVAFTLFTLALIGWTFLLWISLNLLSFPCEEAHPGYTCSQSIWIEFGLQTSIPMLIWSVLAVLIYRKWVR